MPPKKSAGGKAGGKAAAAPEVIVVDDDGAKRLVRASLAVRAVLKLPATRLACVVRDLAAPAAVGESLRRAGIDLRVAYSESSSSRSSTGRYFHDLSDEGVYVARVAVCVALEVTSRVLSALQEKRAHARESSQLAEFFSLCTATFTVEEKDALTNCITAFTNVIPQQTPIAFGLDAAGRMQRQLAILVELRDGETVRRALHGIAAPLSAVATLGANYGSHELVSALPGLSATSLSFWPRASVLSSTIGVAIAAKFGGVGTLCDGVIVSTTSRRSTLCRMLQRVAHHEGYPPFLRSCRKAPIDDSAASLEAPPELAAFGFSAAELPASAFAVPPHREADVSRELEELSQRYLQWCLWLPPRQELLQWLIAARADKLAALSGRGAEMVPLSTGDALSAVDALRLLHLTHSNFGLVLGSLREAPLMPSFKPAAPGGAKRPMDGVETAAMPAPDFIAALVCLRPRSGVEGDFAM